MRQALRSLLYALARKIEAAADNLARCEHCGRNPYNSPPCGGGLDLLVKR